MGKQSQKSLADQLKPYVAPFSFDGNEATRILKLADTSDLGRLALGWGQPDIRRIRFKAITVSGRDAAADWR